MINPAFLNYPEESKLLGELVLGYGELDITFCMACGIATQRKFELLHAVNQVRSESGRMDIANALAVNTFVKMGLEKEYDTIHTAMRFCLKVRNQWAHSQWGDLGQIGLAFTRTDGDAFAQPLRKTVWNSVTLKLLREQEVYFEYTRKCILTVELNLDRILSGKDARLDMPLPIIQPNTKQQWSVAAKEFLSESRDA